MLATAMGDVIAGNNSNTMKAFQEFFESMFPFMAKEKDEKDKALVEKMRQEVQRGPISFSPITRDPLRNAARRFTVPDEYREKLKQKARARGQKATR